MRGGRRCYVGIARSIHCDSVNRSDSRDVGRSQENGIRRGERALWQFDYEHTGSAGVGSVRHRQKGAGGRKRDSLDIRVAGWRASLRYRDSQPFVVIGAPEQSHVIHGAGRTQTRGKCIGRTLQRLRLIPTYGKVARIGAAGHISIAGEIHRNAGRKRIRTARAGLAGAAAEQLRIYIAAAVRSEFGDEPIFSADKARTCGTRKVGREGFASHEWGTITQACLQRD